MTDVALITTTINVPEVLRKYRSFDPDVQIIIAGDRNTPEEVKQLAADIDALYFLHGPDKYRALSETIGWNSIQRRNLATLVAVDMGADVVISIDDDNIPMEPTYFDDVRETLSDAVPRCKATGDWFHLGAYADQPFAYRGLPRGLVGEQRLDYSAGSVSVGVLNGLIYGDPDIDAVERIAINPQVYRYTEEARNGIAFHPSETWAPINSQNTAWRAELAPLMLLMPEVGRYDDIWGSYIAQCVMAETEYHVMFGRPFVDQQRNEQDLLRNLEDEMFGMRYSALMINALRSMNPSGNSILERLSSVCSLLRETDMVLPFDFLDHWLEAWS